MLGYGSFTSFKSFAGRGGRTEWESHDGDGFGRRTAQKVGRGAGVHGVHANGGEMVFTGLFADVFDFVERGIRLEKSMVDLGRECGIALQDVRLKRTFAGGMAETVGAFLNEMLPRGALAGGLGLRRVRLAG